MLLNCPPPAPEPPTVTVTMTPASVVEGAVLNFAATGVGTGYLTYQWNLDDVAIAGATLETYARTTVLADNTKVITCTVTDTHAQAVVSEGQTMAVTVPPVALPDINLANPNFTQAYGEARGYFTYYAGSAGPSFGWNTTLYKNYYSFTPTGAFDKLYALRSNLISGLTPGGAYRITINRGATTSPAGFGLAVQNSSSAQLGIAQNGGVTNIDFIAPGDGQIKFYGNWNYAPAEAYKIYVADINSITIGPQPT
jgi:hypothetical protein